MVLKLQVVGDKVKKNKKEQTDLIEASIVMKFVFDMPNSGNKPTIHLNKKCSKMMFVVDREVAVIYRKGEKVNGYVEWNQINRIQQHPTLL